MRAIQPLLSLVFFLPLVFASCTKKTEVLNLEPVADYVLNKPGKYIIYRTDSTLFTAFGSREEYRYYQEKHLVDAAFTDAAGHTAYRIQRFLRDSAGKNAWAPAGTYSITILPQSVEVTEDNMRVVKLAHPLRLDYSWRGNQYLSENPYSSFYNFSNDNSMVLWDFTYTGIGESLNLNGQALDSVVTVSQVNESDNVPMNGNEYAYLSFSEEKYAKGIGLVYQELLLWEYQIVPAPNREGFGVKRVMIGHN